MTSKHERVDAARNRQAILDAATALFDSEGAADVSMHDIAIAAGVGKGTVFRRFGDRAALVKAVLQPRAQALREAVENGPPPLGPGGAGDDALRAYLDALFQYVWRNRSLIRAFETRDPHVYYTNEASQFWIAELARRLAATAPGLDADYHAHAVFSALRADVIDYLVTERGMPHERIRAGLHTLATGSR